MWFPYWFHPTFSKWTPWYVGLFTLYWFNNRVYLKQLCGNLTPSFTTQIQTGLPVCLTCNVTKHLSSSHTYSLCHHTKLCSVNLNHQQQRSHKYQSLSMVQFLCVFSVRLLSVLRGHSFFHQRPMTSDFEGFLSQILSITFIFRTRCQHSTTRLSRRQWYCSVKPAKKCCQ